MFRTLFEQLDQKRKGTCHVRFITVDNRLWSIDLKEIAGHCPQPITVRSVPGQFLAVRQVAQVEKRMTEWMNDSFIYTRLKTSV